MTAAIQTAPGRARRGGFAAASAALISVFISAGAPVALYGTYRQRDGITDGGLTISYVGYVVAAAFALLVLARLSDGVGRRPVSAAALALAAAGAAVLLHVDDLGVLLLGRVLQGLASGLASTATAAYVIDLTPASRPWLASAITGGGPTGGLAAGALLSGILVQYAPAPTTLVYRVVIGLLALVAAAVACSPETRPRTARIAPLLKPHLGIPSTARPMLAAASVIFAMTWALGGLYQSLGPSIAADELREHSHLAAALIVACMVGATTIGGSLSGRIRSPRVGVTLFGLGVAGAMATVSAHLFMAFLAVGVVAGTGFGLAYATALQALIGGASPQERTRLLSVVYLISYTGAAAPSLLAGQLVAPVGLLGVVLGYAGLTLGAAILAARLLSTPR